MICYPEVVSSKSINLTFSNHVIAKYVCSKDNTRKPLLRESQWPGSPGSRSIPAAAQHQAGACRAERAVGTTFI